MPGRYGRPENVAGAACVFASDGSKYVAGQVLAVDGGVLAAIEGCSTRDAQSLRSTDAWS